MRRIFNRLIPDTRFGKTFLAITLLLGAALTTAVVRSRASLVIVYNDSGEAFGELTISACGQTQSFHEVAYRESVVLRLTTSGSASDIGVATNGVTMWRGEYIEPQGAYRSIVRLRSDGQVESSTSISWWQDCLNSLIPTGSPPL